MIKMALLVTTLFASLNTMAASATPTMPDNVIAHAVTQSTFKLLNLASKNTCHPPVSSDVHPFCFGALPPDIQKPTIAGIGCGFSLTIQCGNGISAKISGSDVGYEVLGPNHAVYDSVNVGIVVHDIEITGI